LLLANSRQRQSKPCAGRVRISDPLQLTLCTLAPPMRKVIAFVGLLGVIYALALQHGAFDRAAALTESAATASARVLQDCDGSALTSAYRTHQSRVEVCGRGVIARVLKDDTQGARHQRFIVRLPAGHTLLIAYNYDLAPRIDGLRAGAAIEFSGEYEWNPQGGVVHWTHRDPAGHHTPGWIRYGGRQYQ
jgi:hypothetical protein